MSMSKAYKFCQRLGLWRQVSKSETGKIFLEILSALTIKQRQPHRCLYDNDLGGFKVQTPNINATFNFIHISKHLGKIKTLTTQEDVINL